VPTEPIIEAMLLQDLGEFDSASGASLWYIEGVSLSGPDLYNATATPSKGDEKNLVVQALGGDDIIELSNFNDRFFGFLGNDDMYGFDGNDDLIGGEGRDRLTGGLGSDNFVYEDLRDSYGKSGYDVILDFSRDQGDRIVLEDIDTSKKSGDQEFKFIGKKSFSDQAGELRFKNGFLYGDINGDGKADFTVQVDGVSSMSATDFEL